MINVGLMELVFGRQDGAVPEDSEMSSKQLERLGRRSSDNGRRVNGSRREMRPSMEARWRKLDISALQVIDLLFRLSTSIIFIYFLVRIQKAAM